jgi:filamentous hemagglutinin family protein
VKENQKKLFSLSMLGKNSFVSSTLVLSLFFSTIQWGFISAAYANPNGGTVVGGSATISGQGTSHVIVNQGSNRAAINWNNFSVGNGERTQFIQPDKNSVAFNRVTGGNASQILGSIDANGKVILANPNGIIFGAGSKVDAAGLVATTHDADTNAFMAGGQLRFNKNPNAAPGASVVNQGTITIHDAGAAAFVAPSVRNDGVIVANQGQAVLGAGNGFTLDLYGDNLVSFQVGDEIGNTVLDANGNPIKALVENNGTIQAKDGQVLLTATTARNVINQAINVSGSIQASSATKKGGKIILSSKNAAGESSGKVVLEDGANLAAKSTKKEGGTIHVLGEHVSLEDSTIDASGKTGGGMVRIGGGYQGGEGLVTAKTALVDEDTTIKANATNKGNGGDVVVWADGATHYAGYISAMGGPNGGNGGSVEVSGKQHLNFIGGASLLAPKGSKGTLLLDPASLNISDDPTDSVNCVSNLCDGNAPSNLNVAELVQLLDIANVTVYTSDGLLRVMNDVSWATDSTLVLSAYMGIENHATISNTYSGGFAQDRIPVLLALLSSNSATDQSAWVDNTVGTIDFSNSTGAVSFYHDYTAGLAGMGNINTNGGWVAPDNHTISSQFTEYVLIKSEAMLIDAMSNNPGGQFALAFDIDGGDGTFNSNAPMLIGNKFSGILDGQLCALQGGQVCGIINYQMHYDGGMGYALAGLMTQIDVPGIVRNMNLDLDINAEWGQADPFYLGALAGLSQGTVANVHSTGNVDYIYTGGTPGQESYVGGLIGSGDTDSFMYISSNVGNVTASASDAGIIAVGGLLGVVLSGHGASIYDSYTAGDIVVDTKEFSIAGGLVGAFMSNGEIRDSYATGRITAASAGQVWVGGLLGSTRNAGYLFDSFATGRVVGMGSDTFGEAQIVQAGGLIGRGHEFSFGDETHYTYALGGVTIVNAKEGFAGGLVGYLTGATIGNSFASGAVYNVSHETSYNGGLVGYAESGSGVYNSYAVGTVMYDEGAHNAGGGGLIGYSGADVGNTYATGWVKASSTAGGLIGRYEGGNVSHSYWHAGTTGQKFSNDGQATGLSELNFDELGGLPGWDPGIWGVMITQDGHVGNPYLMWQTAGGAGQFVGGFYKDSPVGTGVVGAEIAGLLNGSSMQSLLTNSGGATTGANGYYYFLLAPDTIDAGGGDQVATYLNDGEFDTFAFYENAPESIYDMDMMTDGLWAHIKGNNISGMSAKLATALGGLDSSFAYTVSAPNFTMDADKHLVLDYSRASGDVDLDYTVNLSGLGDLYIYGSSGNIGQSRAITANGLGLFNGAFTLTNTGNAITTLAGGSNTTINFLENSGFDLGTVGGHSGLQANDIYFSTTGTVTQSQVTYAVNGMLLSGVGGVYNLTTGSVVTDLAANTGTVNFMSYTSFNIGTVNGTAGITATNTYLYNDYAVTQSQAIASTNLLLSGAATFTLGNSGNSIATLASAGASTINFTEANGFDIGTVNGINGLTATNAYFRLVTGTATQSQAIAASSLLLTGTGTTYTLTNSGNAISTLATSGTSTINFLENSGFAIGSVNGTNGATATDLYLSSSGTVTQSQGISATNLLLQGSGTYTLTNTSNAITTLASSGTGVRNFLENSGFDIGTVNSVSGLTATSAYLSSTGTVTQSQAIAATNLLLQSSGTYTLTNTGNAITTLAASGTSTVDFLENSGFSIGTVNSVNGLTATNVYLSSSSVSVGQTQAITATNLLLQGSGTYSFSASSSNAITTLASSSTGRINFAENSGFDIGTVNSVNGLTASIASLSSTGTVTQSQAITATELGLGGIGGTFTLLNTDNAISKLASTSTGTINFLENSGFSIGMAGSAVALLATNLYLSSAGAVTQSDQVIATNLLLQGAGTYTLDHTSNAITTLAVNGPSTVSFLENSGFDIGTVNSVTGLTATNAYLSSTGTVTQSQGIAATNLLLQSSGTYTLTNTSNAITTLAASGTSTVNFLENSGFDIGTVNSVNGLTATNAYLSSTGTVTQSQAIAATNLLLQSSGTYTLTNTSNAITTLAASGTSTVNFLENSGFDIGTVNSVNGIAATSAYLSSTGTVTQSQRISATNLLLQSSGTYTLTNGSNAITTLAASGTSTVNFLENSGFAIGTVNSVNGLTATSAYLSSTGTVTQSQGIIATNLLLQSSGTYTLTNTNNAITTLAASGTSTVNFLENSGFDIGTVNSVNGLTATNAYLSSTGTVTQSQAIASTTLLLQGTGSTYTLTNTGNAITTLASGGTGVRNFLENSGFAIGTVNSVNGLTATSAYLSSTGTVTQSQGIIATNLLLQSSGTYTLTNTNNAITTLASSGTSTVNFLENTGYAIGTVNSVNGLTATSAYLSSTGTVTQSQAIAVTSLLLQGTGPTYTLTNASNAITTLATSGTGTVNFVESNGYDVGTVNSVNGLTTTNAYLTLGSGTLTQSQALTTTSLMLSGASATFTLPSTLNRTATFAANVGTLDFGEFNGFDIGTVNSVNGLTATNAYLAIGSGTTTQSQAITATNLLLQNAGTYTLTNTSNAITTLAASGTSTINFLENSGFDIGTVNSVNGLTATNVYLSSTGTVTQSQGIIVTSLLLQGSGIYTLTNANNAITTLASSGTGTRNFLENSGYDIGTVNSVNGLTATSAYLSSTGTVTQSQALAVTFLALQGSGGVYTLTNSGNATGGLVADTGTVDFRDDGGFTISTINGVSGITATNVYLTTAGTVTQNATRQISATNLLLQGSGTYTLTESTNAITTLAASGTSTVNFLENSGFAIGTVNGTVGLTAANAYLSSTGTVTQSQAVAATNLLLQGTGTYTLTNTSNAITTLSATGGGTVNFLENSGFDVGTVNSVNGLTANDTYLSSTGTVTQSQPISSTNLLLSGAGGIYTLTDANNSITTLASNTGTVNFLENSGFTVGTVNGTAGLTATNIYLSSTGTVGGSAISTTNLLLAGVGGNYTFINASNAITTLAANTGTVYFR